MHQPQLACKQALWGGTKTRRPCNYISGIEYLLQKSRCNIGGDDISNDVITLSMCFQCLFYIHAHFRFILIAGNLTTQSMGSHRGIGGGIQILEM